MSKKSVIKPWMPAIALLLLPLLRALVVDAAPPGPVLGFTATPTATPIRTPGPSLSRCDPVLSKQVEPSIARPGDRVTFTITVKNLGQQATVNGHVWDTVPDHLEILEVEVLDEHKGLEILPISGQTVRVDTGILGQDAELTILVHTQARPFDSAAGPDAVCVANVAHFDADNCPSRRAEAQPCLLPESGATKLWWMLAAALSTIVLVLSLALSPLRR